MSEATAKGYMDEVAPYPHESEVTAEALVKHLTASVIQRLAGRKDLFAQRHTSSAARDAYMLNVEAMFGEFLAAAMLRALLQRDAVAADEMAQVLYDAWEESEIGEAAWSWAAEYGIDADRLAAEAEAAR